LLNIIASTHGADNKHFSKKLACVKVASKPKSTFSRTRLERSHYAADASRIQDEQEVKEMTES